MAKTGISNGLLEICRKIGHFLLKTVQNLKIVISQKHIFKSYNHAIWPSYEEKWLKVLMIYIFKNQIMPVLVIFYGLVYVST